MVTSDFTGSADLRMILDSAIGVSLIATDTQGLITGFSRGASRLLGYTSADLLGKATPLVFHDTEEIKRRGAVLGATLGRPLEGFAILAAHLGANGVHQGEWTYHRKDGAPVVVDLCISELRDESGALMGYLETAVDITARKSVENSLLQEKRFIEQTLNSLPGIFYLYDAGLCLRQWNRNHESLLGFTYAEIDGKYLGDWFAPGPPRELAVAAASGVVTGKGAPDAIEGGLLHKDGRAIPFLLTGVRLESPTGPMLAGVGIDLTERRRLEERLRQSQKLESVGRLAGGIAHDFNNILTVILGNLELAREPRLLDPSLYDYLDGAVKAAESASQLTRQLLAFSRNQVVTPRVLVLRDALRSLQKLLVRLLGENIALRISVPNELWPTKMDSGQFDQVVLNLAVNARDAMPDGGTLSIECTNQTLGERYLARYPDAVAGDYVCITVTDTGVGMDQSIKSKLFEPFFTTKELGRGTGLGLATVFGAIRQNRGVVDVVSEVGQGTTFHIYLPRCSGVELEPLAVAPQARHPVAASGRGGGETILIAEDDPQIRAIAANCLSALGYRTVVCATGAQAFDAAIAAAPVHLLFTDVVMPDMNGRELAERLLARQPRMRILFTSGYTADIIGRHGILEPETEFLPKPYGPKDLARRVREVLDAPPMHRPVTVPPRHDV